MGPKEDKEEALWAQGAQASGWAGQADGQAGCGDAGPGRQADGRVACSVQILPALLCSGQQNLPPSHSPAPSDSAAVRVAPPTFSQQGPSRVGGT